MKIPRMPSANRKRVRCEHCGGCGQRHLTEVEENTVDACGVDWSTTGQISARLVSFQGYLTSGPALCNRLVDLLKLGLVERKQIDGKSNAWRAKP